MSVSYIPGNIKNQLWGKAGGQCEYKGCPTFLWRDSLTKAEFNSAYIAHIIADQQEGPRGDLILSEKFKKDISNLMLMCDIHHREIDRENGKFYTAKDLDTMKVEHENRVELILSLKDNQQSNVLLYGANINDFNQQVSFDLAVQAMLPHHYPAQKIAIELSLKNSQFRDNEESYWKVEAENLRRAFKSKISPLLEAGISIPLSVFALAPQPLLIELGRLISDIQHTEIYQLHKEPVTWKWQKEPRNFDYVITQPTNISSQVALNLSLSGDIDNKRIIQVLGDNTSIWTITVDKPNNDFLQSIVQLSKFRKTLRRVYNEIKLKHGEQAVIHIFPAVPVSVAIEVGRVWMPKADLPLYIYDQNSKNNGFVFALKIENT